MATKPFPHREPRWRPMLLLTALVNLASCAAPGWTNFSSLVENQPFVLEFAPAAESRVDPEAEFTLRFSERIDLGTLREDAVALLFNAEEKIFSKTAAFINGLRAGDFPQIALQVVLSSEENELTLLPEAALADGIYHLVITPVLRSTQGLPFNQSPGETPTLFIARYAVGEIALSQLEKESDGKTAAPAFGPEPVTLMLHEFLYDGKISETDGEAFIELFGTPGADISLYQILLINGANGKETDRITLPPNSILRDDGIFLIADLRTGSKTVSMVPNADFLDHFDPQNGPDGIQLLNRNGELLDTVAYGNGAVEIAVNGLPLGEGSPALDVAAGHSLSRVNGIDTDDNAADFVDLSEPTPGLP